MPDTVFVKALTCPPCGLTPNRTRLLMNARGFRLNLSDLYYDSFPPEFQLLLTCAREPWTTRDEARLRSLLQNPLDWDFIERQSRNHGILPLVYRAMSTSMHALVPSTIQEQVRRTFQRHVLWCLLVTARLLEVLRLLESYHIRVIPFKGPVMAQQLYGDISLRQYSDLDILVRPDDLDAAIGVLLTNGFKRLPGSSVSSEDAFLAEPRCHVQLISQDGRLLLELHYDIGYVNLSPRYSSELFCRDVRTSRFEGHAVWTPSPEALLLYLCVHGAAHYWERLGWICDVAWLTHRQELNWDKLWGMAQDAGCREIVFLGLHLAWSLLDAPVPEHALPKGRELRTAEKSARSIVKGWLRRRGRYGVKLTRRLFYLKITDRREDQLQLLTRIVTHPPRAGSIRTLSHAAFFVHLAFRTAQAVARLCFSIGSWLKSGFNSR